MLVMSNNKVVNPYQCHTIFYYQLDIDHSVFYFVNKEYHFHSSEKRILMIHLNNNPEFRIYYIDVHKEPQPRKSYHQVNIEYKYHTEIKKEMSRNEFFSQDALGTLEGEFIATRDVEYLRKYLVQKES